MLLYMGKESLLMWLRILKWGVILDCPGGSWMLSHVSLQNGGRERLCKHRGGGNLKTRQRDTWRCWPWSLERCDHRLRKASSPHKTRFPHKPPEGAQPRWPLSFGSVALIADVWPSELRENQFLLFYATKFVIIVTATRPWCFASWPEFTDFWHFFLHLKVHNSEWCQ